MFPYFSSGYVEVAMELKAAHSDLYTFGFYGRNFLKDGMEPSSADSSSIRTSVVVLVTLISVYFFGRYFKG